MAATTYLITVSGPDRPGIAASLFAAVSPERYPDIVISKINGGLHAYLNPGTKPGPYTDATTGLGLDAPACGAGLTGGVELESGVAVVAAMVVAAGARRGTVTPCVVVA